MTAISANKKYTVSFSLLIAAVALVIWTLLRLILSLQVGFSLLDFNETLKVFLYGLWFDAAALAYLIAPWLLLSALVPAGLRSKSWVNSARWGLAFLVTFGLLFGAVSEFIFWQEFTTRFNFIAVDYLIYTNEVIGNIRESYPVPLILLGIALVVVGLLFTLSQWINFDGQAKTKGKRLSFALIAMGLPLLSYLSANVDQMEFGHNNYANELAGNGIFSFSAAARRNELDYDKFYRTLPQEQALMLLKSLGGGQKDNSKLIG